MLLSPKGLIVARWSTLKMVQSCAWQGGAGLCQAGGLSFYVGFSMGLFECLYNMKAGFPLRGGCRRARQRLYPFDDFSSHKASHFCYILWLEGNQKKKKKRRESLSPTHIPGEGKRELSKNLQTYFKTTVILITFSRNMLKTIFLNLQHLSG